MKISSWLLKVLMTCLYTPPFPIISAIYESIFCDLLYLYLWIYLPRVSSLLLGGLTLHIQILPYQIRRSHIMQLPLWLLQVVVPLRVFCNYCMCGSSCHSLPDMTWRHTAQCAARSLFCTNCMAVSTFWTIGKSVYVVFNNVHYYLYSLTRYISCEWWNIGIKVKLTDNNFEKGRNSTNYRSSSLRWSRKIWPISFMHVIRFYNLIEGNKCYENSLNRFIK